MPILKTGQIFASGDQVTSQKLMDIADLATFDDPADGSTIIVNSQTYGISGGDGKLKVPSGGITSNELATNSVTSDEIVDGAVTTGKINNSAVTLSKIENIATSKVIGRTTAGSGDPEEVDLLDEDDMASNSNTSLATQQSIKAYVDDTISSGPQIFAFSSGNITTQAQHVVNYPSGWTHGLPDKVLVSTRYPTGDGSSQTWFQVVTFDSTSVTVYSQTQNVANFTAVIADLLLVKN